ncbi:MAG: hypothetical protein MJE68_12255 [Proteobacteria bacterium]|nr:hypothetical protein [Pseudomonadota bacterium]
MGPGTAVVDEVAARDIKIKYMYLLKCTVGIYTPLVTVGLVCDVEDTPTAAEVHTSVNKITSMH